MAATSEGRASSEGLGTLALPEGLRLGSLLLPLLPLPLPPILLLLFLLLAGAGSLLKLPRRAMEPACPNALVTLFRTFSLPDIIMSRKDSDELRGRGGEMGAAGGGGQPSYQIGPVLP